ncbi:MULTISPECIES: hypothetical protein [unclassified Caballeronia]|uniref:hypothetical protein n=2 Tax=unclassified Caballeronia TaxID=2646786 RepID=UPI002028E96A|nr:MULTISPECIES: hypothetical protein [unclassified Caballeronia]
MHSHSKVFARSTPTTPAGMRHKRARTLLPRDAEPKSQKKMGATPIFFNRDRTQGREKNYVPSDFVILAIFRDKRKRRRPVQARFVPEDRLFGLHLQKTVDAMKKPVDRYLRIPQ